MFSSSTASPGRMPRVPRHERGTRPNSRQRENVRMKAFLQRLLRIAAGHPRFVPLRSTLRAQLVLLGQDGRIREKDPPRGDRLLVLAPHMDDEIFGCGGTLVRCARRGASVTVVYITDGRKGYDLRGKPHASEAEQERFEEALVSQRRDEAAAVGELLGFEAPVFLDCRDGAWSADPQTVRRFSDLLQRQRPTAVFLPFMTDPHRDHWVTNWLFMEAAARAGLASATECWGYEVWAPLQANSIVDITDVMADKEAAMRRYESQLRCSDFPRAFAGLNSYRSLFARRGQGYAEAFWSGSLASYRALYEAMTVLAGEPSSSKQEP